MMQEPSSTVCLALASERTAPLASARGMGRGSKLAFIRREFPIEIVRAFPDACALRAMRWWLATHLGDGTSVISLNYPTLPLGDWAETTIWRDMASFHFRYPCDAALFFRFGYRLSMKASDEGWVEGMPFRLKLAGPGHIETYRSIHGMMKDADPERWVADGDFWAPLIRFSFRDAVDATFTRAIHGRALSSG